MSNVSNGNRKKSIESVVSLPKNFDQAANDLCERALKDAKVELHPLTRNTALDLLDKHYEFLEAFKLALEQRIAQRLAGWHTGVQAVFAFDEAWIKHPSLWDSSIHLLVKVPRLSHALKTIGQKMDRSLVKYLKQLGWSRFSTSKSILEVQQVTPNELRHGISYGAMFCAAHNIPVKVWPQKRIHN